MAVWCCGESGRGLTGEESGDSDADHFCGWGVVVVKKNV